MRSIDLFWFRSDLFPGNRDSLYPQSCYSARYNSMIALGNNNVNSVLILHHPFAQRENRIQWNLGESIILLPFLGNGKIKKLTSYCSLFFYLIYALIVYRPKVIMSDLGGVIPLIPLAIFNKLIHGKVQFCLDIRSVSVETSSTGKPRLGGFSQTFESYQYQLAAKYFDKFSFITPSIKNKIESDHHVVFKSPGYWSSGVNTTLFCPSQASRTNDMDRKFRLIYHGTISETRGVDDLIYAVGLALEKIPNLELVILGIDHSEKSIEPVIQKLYKIRDELGIERQVVFMKPVPHNEVPRILNEANIGILPWRNESWWVGQSALKLLEYLSCGLPVIATDIDAARQVIGNSNCGVYCDSNNPNSLARMIILLYEEYMYSPEKLNQRGIEGRNLVASYSWDTQIKKLIEYLEL